MISAAVMAEMKADIFRGERDIRRALVELDIDPDLEPDAIDWAVKRRFGSDAHLIVTEHDFSLSVHEVTVAVVLWREDEIGYVTVWSLTFARRLDA